MSALSTDLRNKLERTIIEARDVAEAGARAALEALAVHHHEPYPHQKPEQRKLRNQLRAHARQLGDIQNSKGALKIEHLVHECAYEHWHRMLFARFLAENNLLIEPESGVSISLRDAEDLAKEAKVDLWTYASRCAQQMLPQIFRPDDPLLQVGLANEHRVKLERLLASLDPATFKADDALGWVYQFWQSKKKDQVNASGEKITGDTLPAVTQLFTEHYMVLFLLHNTIGAWHAGKVLTFNPNLSNTAASEEELRQAVALTTCGGYSFEYLRFVRGTDGGPWRPAAGAFEGWPKTASLLKLLDPCCGSGHFLIAAFELLVRLRMAEENLSVSDAIDAVLRDNIHGLELDSRCTQIAAFNLAMAAWKLAGHRKLPPMHIACTGMAPQATVEQWLKLAEQAIARAPMRDRDPLRLALRGLHGLFADAPTLGSLIDPNRTSMIGAADWETVEPYLASAMQAEADDEEHERAVAAAGIATAAKLLAGEYTLVITNVPYLGRGKQNDTLQAWANEFEREAKADLATMFISRGMNFLAKGGTFSVVSPQNWLFLTTFRSLRERLLRDHSWNIVARLGSNAFQNMNWWAATTALLAIGRGDAATGHMMMGIDVSADKQQPVKAAMLRGDVLADLHQLAQAGQRKNPDAAIVLEGGEQSHRLGEYARVYQGIGTSDINRFVGTFWQTDSDPAWVRYQMAPEKTSGFSGCYGVLRWDSGEGELAHSPYARICGQPAWEKEGVAISVNGALPRSRYFGEHFDCTTGVLVANDRANLHAIVCFLEQPEFPAIVRGVDQALSVTERSFEKVPFDLAHWQRVAAETYPNGLPEPESNDPTQWLFHGRPEASTAPMQVAVARLLGYRWPAELDGKMRLSKRARDLASQTESLLKFADEDGIVCIPSVRGEEPAADRLLAMLTACGIKPDRDLDDWLRNEFFKEHCELFHQRPFIWHIWDGRKRDGFHALINYHKLADAKTGRKLLENLTYSYLNDWINRQQDGVKRGEDGAEDRLAAAMELQKRLVAILKGEPPFDIFVRWKPLHEQPIGWEPDINDGVRVNIRPCLASDIPGARSGAGILRVRPGSSLHWKKDRGKEPDRKKSDYPWFWGWDEKTVDFTGGKEFDGNRWNDCHYTIAAKRAARGE